MPLTNSTNPFVTGWPPMSIRSIDHGTFGGSSRLTTYLPGDRLANENAPPSATVASGRLWPLIDGGEKPIGVTRILTPDVGAPSSVDTRPLIAAPGVSVSARLTRSGPITAAPRAQPICIGAPSGFTAAEANTSYSP